MDRPSTESFGIVPLIVKSKNQEFYTVLGLSKGVKKISPPEFDRQYGGHILKVELALPSDLSNPVALWLGTEFCKRAELFEAPTVPERDETWNLLLKPNANSGRYKIVEPAEAYSTAYNWTYQTGIKALRENNFELAQLMNWCLPHSEITMAALYFTASTQERKQRELAWQLKLFSPKLSVEQIIAKHEETRQQLLG